MSLPFDLKMHVLLAYLVTVVALLLVNGQDFGFPEETGLSKDKQNADVSTAIRC